MVSELNWIHAHVGTILDITVMQRDFDDLRNGASSVGPLKFSLRDLIALSYVYHEQPVILLIDEYDAPMIEGWTFGYYDDISQLMLIWLGGGLKHDNA